jgi:iron complex outermembrane receptor protein
MRGTTFAAASVCVIAAFGTSAQAQTPDAAQQPSAASRQPDGAELQEVVVTGVRRSLQNAINTKRIADTVVDAISAEDVGKFPTENVAESLQRVTGIQITRFRGEAQNVTIRGLPPDFTLVQLNGHQLTSAIGPTTSGLNRSFDFTILPSEFVSSIEVYKAPTADLEEGGLAGTVIAHTVRPLDIGKRKFAGTLSGENESNRDKWAPRASAFYTDVFADGKFGVSLGAAYTRKYTETDEQRITRYRRVTEASAESGKGLDLNGDGNINRKDPTVYAMLDQDFQTIDREDDKRQTYNLTLQARPNDNWDFTAESLYSKVNIVAPSYSDLLRLGIGASGPVVPGSVVIEQRQGNSNPTGDNGQPVNLITSMDLQGVDERADGRRETRDGDVLSVSLGGAWHTDGMKISTELSHSRATQLRSNPLEENQRNGKGGDVIYDTRLNPDLMGFIRPGVENTARLDPANYQLLSFNGEWGRHRQDRNNDLSIDLDKDIKWGWLDSIKVGTRAAERKVDEDARTITGTSAQLASLWDGKSQPPPADLFLVPIHPSTGTFLDAKGNTSSVFPQVWLDNDVQAFMNAFGAQRIESLSTVTNDPSGATHVKERTYALYFRANLGLPGTRLTGNAGVRVVRTQQTAVGVIPDLNNITFQPSAGSATRVPSAGLLTVNRNYLDVLPSLNLKYDLTNDLLLRLAASRTMSRPTLSQISPTVTASGSTQSLTAKNPYLDPFRSNNVDLAAEWYFNEGGLVAATLFYKDIVSQIIPLQTLIPVTVTIINPDGSRTPSPQTWTRSSLVNGPGTSVNGAELSYQQNLTFLPWPLDGLGLLANYTYMQSHGGSIPLTGASKNNYTGTLYYEKGRIGGRVAYTYRGKYYVSNEATTKDDLIQQPYGTLDANVTFTVTNHLSLIVEATNILQDTDRSRFEPIDLPGNYQDDGRRVMIGVRGSF